MVENEILITRIGENYFTTGANYFTAAIFESWERGERISLSKRRKGRIKEGRKGLSPLCRGLGREQNDVPSLLKYQRRFN